MSPVNQEHSQGASEENPGRSAVPGRDVVRHSMYVHVERPYNPGKEHQVLRVVETTL